MGCPACAASSGITTKAVEYTLSHLLTKILGGYLSHNAIANISIAAGLSSGLVAYLLGCKYIGGKAIASYNQFLLDGNPHPFHISEDLATDPLFATIDMVNPESEMYGTENDNLMIAPNSGGILNAGIGLSYMVSGEGANIFKFAVEQIKLKNGDATVIDHFKDGIDKIEFICNCGCNCNVENLSLDLTNYKGHEVTIVDIDYEDIHTAISVTGHHPYLLNDITITNLF